MFKAVIFDLDGVITDTEPIHLSAWRYVLRRDGIAISDDEYKQHYLGLNDLDFITAVGRMKRRSFSDFEKQDLIKRKLQKSLHLLKMGVPILPGVTELIKTLSARIPLAICSGSIRQEVDYILKFMGWERIFYPVVTGDDVAQGKPHPQGYLSAISKLKQKDHSIDSQHCLAIEDSPKGVSAAKAAEIKCLALTTFYPENELGGADFYAKDLKNIPEHLKKELGM